MFTGSSNMDKNCFLCNVKGDDGSFSSDSQNNSLILCQILNVPYMENNRKRLEYVFYCHPCTTRILNLHDFLEKLEKLEEIVLQEKYLIALQLKKNYQHSFGSELLYSSDQFKSELLTEMRFNLIKSNLGKIAKEKQISQKKFPRRRDVRIMNNITILKNVEDRIVVHNIPKRSINSKETAPPLIDDLIHINEQEILSESIPNVKPGSCQFHVTSDNIINSPFINTELPQTSYPYDFHDIKFETFKAEINHSTEVRDPFEGIVSELDFETYSKEIAPVKHLVNSLHEGNIFIHTKETPDIEQDNIQILQMSEDPTTPKTFICGTCKAGFDDYNTFNIHYYTHNEENPSKFKYGNSDRTVQTKFDFKTHECIHTREEPFKCQYCKKTFCNADEIKNHERTHTVGEYSYKWNKPYKCCYCEQGFSSPKSCQEHECRHRGERPYKCNYCENTFVQKRYCYDHERIHTGEKPFKCRYCGYACTSLRSRRAHEIKHENKSKKRPCI